MFDVSFSELLLVGVVALIVIGPERLPKVARTVGHLVGRAQRYVSDVKSDIKREIDANELGDLQDEMKEAASSIKASFSETEKTLRTSVDDVHQSVQNTVGTLNDTATTLKADVLSREPGQTVSVDPDAPMDSQTSDEEPAPQSAADLDPLTLPLPGLEPPASDAIAASTEPDSSPAHSNARSSTEAPT